MTMPAPRPRSTRQGLADREFALGRVARPSLLTVGWRWRYELLLSVVVPGAVWLLVRAIGAPLACVVITGSLALVMASPPLRLLVTACAWCVITAHRVRTGMAQAWIHSRDGKMPFVLRTARKPFGERVYLWCRAGTSAEDFVWARHLIVAACWAREVRVLRSERFVHLVVLDVIRHADSQFAGRDISLADRAGGLQPDVRCQLAQRGHDGVSGSAHARPVQQHAADTSTLRTADICLEVVSHEHGVADQDAG